jgi:hypothetical protein
MPYRVALLDVEAILGAVYLAIWRTASTCDVQILRYTIRQGRPAMTPTEQEIERALYEHRLTVQPMSYPAESDFFKAGVKYGFRAGHAARDGEVAWLRQALENTMVIALEQRCERGTPWDTACIAIADKLREHIEAALAPAQLSDNEGRDE